MILYVAIKCQPPVRNEFNQIKELAEKNDLLESLTKM